MGKPSSERTVATTTWSVVRCLVRGKLRFERRPAFRAQHARGVDDPAGERREGLGERQGGEDQSQDEPDGAAAKVGRHRFREPRSEQLIRTML